MTENNRLKIDFFKENAISLAPLVLGKLIARNINGEIKRYRITELEIYYGEEDTACHAHKGKTMRTETLYKEGGILYVYLCYGIHYLLNIVTGPLNHPEALLIRSVTEYNGPGRVTRNLLIDKSFNNENIGTSNRIWLEDDGLIFSYCQEKRVGIDYANACDREKLWRFSIKK